MRREIYFLILFLAALAFFPFMETKTVNADDPTTTRETVRSQLKHIASFMDRERNNMRRVYGSAYGNILKGNSGWGCDPDSLNGARNRAYKECGKNGGGCEELFTIGVHNDTPDTINIYLFHPWEIDFDEGNALWNWTWQPGQGTNLGVDGCLLFVSKRFFLKAKPDSGSREWGVRKIEDFGYTQRNYRDGQNLLIRLVP